MKRYLDGGYELDDDPARIDHAAVHAIVLGAGPLARGAGRADRRCRARRGPLSRRRAGRILAGAFGRTRSVVPRRRLRPRGTSLSRARGELVRFSLDEGPFARTKWLLHTRDAHGLYRAFGFTKPSERVLERGGKGE